MSDCDFLLQVICHMMIVSIVTPSPALSESAERLAVLNRKSRGAKLVTTTRFTPHLLLLLTSTTDPSIAEVYFAAHSH